MKPTFAPVPEASSPQNRLEELLVSVAVEPGLLPEFYAELLQAVVYVPVATNLRDLSEQRAADPAFEPDNLEIGLQFSDDGWLYVYSSQQRATEGAKAQPGYDPSQPQATAKAPAGGILDMMVRNPEPFMRGVVLNPHSAFQRELPLAEAAQALRAHLHGGTLRDLRHGQIEPQLAPLPAKHQRLALAVVHFCEQHPDVHVAYLGMVQVLASKPAKPFVWYYTPVRNPAHEHALGKLVQRLYHVRYAVLVRQVTADDVPDGIQSPADMAVYFGPYGILPAFERPQ